MPVHRNVGGPPSGKPFFIVLAILAIALTGVFIFQYSVLVSDFRFRQIEELHLRTEALAVREEALISARLDDIDRRLEVEMQDLTARAYTGGEVDEQILDRLRFRVTTTTNYLIVDGEGTVRAWTGEDDPPESIGRQALSAHRSRETPGPILSEPFREEGEDSALASISRSDANSAGEPEWALVAVVDLNRLADTVDVTNDDELRSTSLIGQSGHVYFHRPLIDGGTPLVIEDVGGIENGEPRLTSSRSFSPFDERAKVSAELASESWPVVVRVSEDLAPALSEIQLFRRQEAIRWSIIGGAFVLLLLALAVSAGRHIKAAQMLSEREARLRDVALHDGLTGLATRMLVTDRLEQLIVQAERAGFRIAVVYIDLDKFKPINDDLGHAAGDDVLKTVGQRMSEAIRQSDTLGRLGGDEFIAVLSNVSDSDAAVYTAGKIVRSLEDPMVVENTKVHVGASAGVALYPEHGTTVTGLLTAADHAMYSAKNTGSHVHLAVPLPDSQSKHDRSEP